MRRATILVVLLGVTFAGCGGPRSSSPTPGGTDPLLPEDRLALPEYDLATFEAMLEELRGKPVVVNIWGSWCPPCEVEAPGLAKVSRALEGRVQFVGVDILDTRAAARDFILRYDWPYPSVFDPRAAIRDGLGYTGQPVTVVYDREGRVAWEWPGVVSEEQLRSQIERVL